MIYAPFPGHDCTSRSVLGLLLPVVGKRNAWNCKQMPQISAGSSCKLCFVNFRADQKQNQAFKTEGHPSTPGAWLPESSHQMWHFTKLILIGVSLEGSAPSAPDPSWELQRRAEDQENCKKYCCSRRLVGAVCNSLEAAATEGIFVSRTAACFWHLLSNSRNRAVI